VICGARYSNNFRVVLVSENVLYFHFQKSAIALKLYRHLPFLKAVLLFTLSAFGGPQGHFAMMLKTFVHKRKDLTEQELLELNAFCQLLPGPSSTQTIMLIGMKRGGLLLGLISLLIWLLPAALFMIGFSFLYHYVDGNHLQDHILHFLQPMSLGFIAYAAWRMTQTYIKKPVTKYLLIGSALLTIAFRSPWVFPLLIIVSGIVSSMSSKRVPRPNPQKQKINWNSILLFSLVFIVAGILSFTAKSQGWQMAKLFNLFENFYRFGSTVFGGGQVLLPMMLYQYVNLAQYRGEQPFITSSELLTGFGMVQALPGPVFSICAYVGSMAMRDAGLGMQLFGGLLTSFAIFLPSTLLLLFSYPIYNRLKQNVLVYRSLEGIHAAIVGIIWASGYVILDTIPFEWSNLVVIAITFCLLNYTKIPAPLIVLGWLFLGWSMYY
jgi:chromate transporter